MPYTLINSLEPSNAIESKSLITCDGEPGESGDNGRTRRFPPAAAAAAGGVFSMLLLSVGGFGEPNRMSEDGFRSILVGDVGKPRNPAFAAAAKGWAPAELPPRPVPLCTLISR